MFRNLSNAHQTFAKEKYTYQRFDRLPSVSYIFGSEYLFFSYKTFSKSCSKTCSFFKYRKIFDIKKRISKH